jgi:DNA-binding protein Fis/phage terminase Nu1 subunit (DNA packaging protein)
VDEELRNLEREASSGDPAAEDRLEAAINRVHGSPERRAWTRELDRISQQIPENIDAVFDFWRVLNRKSSPTIRDFRELFSWALKSNWFTSVISDMYESLASSWLSDRWEDGFGNGITGWDFGLVKDTYRNKPLRGLPFLRLGLGLAQPSHEEAEDQMLEIDEYLGNLEYDLDPLHPTAHCWNLETNYETNGEEDEDELKVYAGIEATYTIQFYHVLAILKAHNKYATEEMAEQYVELIEKKDWDHYTIKKRLAPMRRNPLGTLQKFFPRDRGSKPTIYCQHPNCGSLTREGKAYCSEHIEEIPYVQKISSMQDSIKKELAAVKRRGKVAIPKTSSIIADIIHTLEIEEEKLQGDLAKASGISLPTASIYYDQMQDWGMVEIRPHGRSNLIIFKGKHPSEQSKALNNLQETAKIFDVAKSTVMAWVDKGAPHQTKISGPRGGRRRFYFNIDALRSWHEEMKLKKTSGLKRGKMIELPQAAKELGVDRQSLVRWAKRGAPHLAERFGPKKGRIRYFFDIGKVKKWLQKEIASTEIQGQLGLGVLEARVPSEEGAPILLSIRNQLYLKQKEFAKLLGIRTNSLDAYIGQKSKTIPSSVIEKAQALLHETKSIKQRVIEALNKHGGKRSFASRELGVGLAKINQWIDEYDLHSHVWHMYADAQFTVSQLREVLTKTKGHRGKAAEILGITAPTLTRLMRKTVLDSEFPTGRKYITWPEAQAVLQQTEGSITKAAEILGIGKATLSRFLKRHREQTRGLKRYR